MGLLFILVICSLPAWLHDREEGRCAQLKAKISISAGVLPIDLIAPDQSLTSKREARQQGAGHQPSPVHLDRTVQNTIFCFHTLLTRAAFQNPPEQFPPTYMTSLDQSASRTHVQGFCIYNWERQGRAGKGRPAQWSFHQALVTSDPRFCLQ